MLRQFRGEFLSAASFVCVDHSASSKREAAALLAYVFL
jgi:hypothetical protein